MASSGAALLPVSAHVHLVRCFVFELVHFCACAVLMFNCSFQRRRVIAMVACHHVRRTALTICSLFVICVGRLPASTAAGLAAWPLMQLSVAVLCAAVKRCMHAKQPLLLWLSC
jgi:hypothetical protein